METLPFYAEAERHFEETFRKTIKSSAESLITFDYELSTQLWRVTSNETVSVRVTREWLYPRFGIVVPRSLEKADELNGWEFKGVALVYVDAVRYVPAANTDPAALALVSKKHKELNSKWFTPASGLRWTEAYSIERKSGVWSSTPYHGASSSNWKAPREHWLCSRPRPDFPASDPAALEAEVTIAFEGCKRDVNGERFSLLFYGDEADGQSIQEHIAEYQGVSIEKFNHLKLSPAERENGIANKLDLRLGKGAYRYTSIKLRPRASTEAIPRTYCSVGGTKTSTQWEPVSYSAIHAIKENGTWHFTDSLGELVPPR